jgi:hypothetical protein
MQLATFKVVPFAIYELVGMVLSTFEANLDIIFL